MKKLIVLIFLLITTESFAALKCALDNDVSTDIFGTEGKTITVSNDYVNCLRKITDTTSDVYPYAQKTLGTIFFTGVSGTESELLALNHFYLAGLKFLDKDNFSETLLMIEGINRIEKNHYLAIDLNCKLLKDVSGDVSGCRNLAGIKGKKDASPDTYDLTLPSPVASVINSQKSADGFWIATGALDLYFSQTKNTNDSEKSIISSKLPKSLQYKTVSFGYEFTDTMSFNFCSSYEDTEIKNSLLKDATVDTSNKTIKSAHTGINVISYYYYPYSVYKSDWAASGFLGWGVTDLDINIKFSDNTYKTYRYLNDFVIAGANFYIPRKLEFKQSGDNLSLDNKMSKFFLRLGLLIRNPIIKNTKLGGDSEIYRTGYFWQLGIRW